MKKLILSAAILLGSLSSFAQTTPTEGDVVKSTASTTSQATEATTDGYKEIKLEEVPVAVTKSLKKSVPEAKLVNAYINEKKEYKLQVEMGDKTGSLYATADGKWIN